MFGIYVTESFMESEKGWLKNIKIHKGEKYSDPYCGLQRIEPIYAKNRSEIKTWKTESSAIKYAKGLEEKFTVLLHTPGKEKRYTPIMKYKIEVMNMVTNERVYLIQKRTGY